MSALDWMNVTAFAIGLAFGAVGQATGFCLLSGLRGWWRDHDGRAIRSFSLAAAVAVAGTAALAAAGWVDPGKSIYRSATVSFPVLIVGGLIFGYGMAMANGCGARALVLLGRGNLRSFVVILCLVIGAQATLKGVFAPARQAAQQASAVRPEWATLGDLLAATGLAPGVAGWIAVLLVVAVLGAFALTHAPFRASPRALAGGVLIGLLIPAGWFAAGHIGADEFDPAPVASLGFIAPMADALMGLMFSTGGVAQGIGVPVVAGVLAGGFVTAAATRRLALEGFDSPARMLRYIGGGTLMGVGGVLALGCSIGQGLSGLSTLALASFVAFAALLAGALAGLRGPLRVG